MDATQWPLIVHEHTPLVWRTAYRLLADRDDAADCYQETFVAAWEVAARQPVRNWPALLQRLATHRALDQLRRRRRRSRRHEDRPRPIGAAFRRPRPARRRR